MYERDVTNVASFLFLRAIIQYEINLLILYCIYITIKRVSLYIISCCFIRMIGGRKADEEV